jgi:hypothetical protein
VLSERAAGMPGILAAANGGRQQHQIGKLWRLVNYRAVACVFAAVLLAGCGGRDYPSPEPAASSNMVTGPYVSSQDPTFTCTEERKCEHYGACCREEMGKCVSVCSTCSDRDTLQTSFQCYEATGGAS